jgi:hypothetical protein
MNGQAVWFNTEEFSVLQLVVFGIGCFGWVVAYLGTLQMLFRHRFLEIPAAAVCANVAWEFVWGFLYPNQLGLFFTWGYRAWFFLDVFITYNLFRYGVKQVDTPAIRKHFVPICAATILAWAVGIYFFVRQGYDTGVGAVSGYVLNVMMSWLYITLVLRHSVTWFSDVVAWSKMLGTAVLTVWNLTLPTLNGVVITLGVVTFILDVAYIALLIKLRREQRQAIAGVIERRHGDRRRTPVPAAA